MWYLLRHSIWLFGILSDILSGIHSDILSGILSGLCSRILIILYIFGICYIRHSNWNVLYDILST